MSKKTMPSLVPATQLLEKAYDKAIDLFPDNVQEVLQDVRPIIVIQTNGKRRVYGWHARERWNGGAGNFSEITVTSERLGDGLFPVIDTLVHEMVHHANNLLDVVDVTSNQYHNKKFKTLAERVGLEVTRSYRGYAHTKTTTQLEEIIKSWKLDETILNTYRNPIPRARGGSSLKKWACECGYGIRIAVKPEQVNLYCGVCNAPVVLKKG